MKKELIIKSALYIKKRICENRKCKKRFEVVLKTPGGSTHQKYCCKVCAKNEYQKRDREKNPEKHALYRKLHPPSKEAMKKWRNNNFEYRKKYNKEYVKKHPRLKIKSYKRDTKQMEYHLQEYLKYKNKLSTKLS